MNQQMQKMTNAFNNVAKAIEMDAASGSKGKKKSRESFDRKGIKKGRIK